MMKNRLQSNAKNPVVITEAFTKEYFLKRLYLTALNSLEQEWEYPVCWLSFSNICLPALSTIGQMSHLFFPEFLSLACSKGLRELEAAQGIGGRAAGKRFYESVQAKPRIL